MSLFVKVKIHKVDIHKIRMSVLNCFTAGNSAVQQY